MKLTSILQEFETISVKLGIRIIHEKGNFKGGFCLLEEKGIIVINKHKPLEQRIQALAKAFANLDTSKIYLKPVIRKMIELKIDTF